MCDLKKVQFTYPFICLLLIYVFSFSALAVSDSVVLQGNFITQQQQRLLALGYLDVTAYGATPNNNADDDLLAIQTSIDDAYTNRLSVYFPEGVYEVSNTVGVYRWRNSAQDSRANVLVGDHLAVSRPVIKLKTNAPGFNDAANPRAVIEVQTFAKNQPASTKPKLNLIIVLALPLSWCLLVM